jgi:polyisoprenoid-binding protein YceI
MKKIILSSILFSAVAFAGPLPTTASAKSINSILFKGAAGETEFSAVGKPAMIKINGKGQGPEGVVTYSGDVISGTIKVDLNKLTTEIDMRDDHMKNKYLEVQKYPTADLTFKDFKLAAAVDQLTDSENEMPFTADLTMHGKTKPVSGTMKFKKSQKIISGTAEFSVKIMEYLETLPSYAGIKIAEDVKIKVTFSGTLQ